MKDQHKHIKGYRDLNADEIAVINLVKNMGSDLGMLINVVREKESTDQRWASIAETHLQQGIMALVRSVAKPDSF